MHADDHPLRELLVVEADELLPHRLKEFHDFHLFPGSSVDQRRVQVQVLLRILLNYAEQRAIRALTALSLAVQRIYDVYVREILPRDAHEVVSRNDLRFCDFIDVLVLGFARVLDKLHDEIQQRLPKSVHLFERLLTDLLTGLDANIDNRELCASHLLVQF